MEAMGVNERHTINVELLWFRAYSGPVKSINHFGKVTGLPSLALVCPRIFPWRQKITIFDNYVAEVKDFIPIPPATNQ